MRCFGQAEQALNWNCFECMLLDGIPPDAVVCLLGYMGNFGDGSFDKHSKWIKVMDSLELL